MFPKIAIGLIVGLVAALAGYRLSVSRGSKRKFTNEKLDVIPIIDSFIGKAKNNNAPNVIKEESIRALTPKYFGLKLIVTGRRLKQLNETWDTLRKTTEAEMAGSSKTGVFDENFLKQKEELEKVQQILISRLEGFKKVVESL